MNFNHRNAINSLNIFLVIILLSESTEVGASKSPTHVTIITNLGDITVELFWDSAPKTCENFVGLAQKGYYNQVIFHRIIKDFMIQGGDPTGTGRGGTSIWGHKFEDEFDPKRKHDGPGVLSMANSGPDTNGSQFFITLTATPHLNGKHTVFGKVIKGLDVVLRMGSVETDRKDKPIDNVFIKTIRVNNH